MGNPQLNSKSIVQRRLLTGTEVALILNISNAQAYLMMREGLITTVKFGRSVRVRPEDLQTFIERNVISDGRQSEDGSYIERDTPKSLEEDGDG